MSQPQDGPRRKHEKKRRSRKLAAWRSKQTESKSAPAKKS
jgi:hypothetical protein